MGCCTTQPPPPTQLGVSSRLRPRGNRLDQHGIRSRQYVHARYERYRVIRSIFQPSTHMQRSMLQALHSTICRLELVPRHHKATPRDAVISLVRQVLLPLRAAGILATCQIEDEATRVKVHSCLRPCQTAFVTVSVPQLRSVLPCSARHGLLR